MTELKKHILDEGKYDWYDVKHAPFAIYGLYRGEEDTDPRFRRTPQAIGDGANEYTKFLCYNTAGGRIRFSTDARELAIYVHYCFFDRSNHMCFNGECGLDLYHDDGDRHTYVCTMTPNLDTTIEQKSEYYHVDTLINRTPDGINCYTLNMPLYCGVDDIMIGVPRGCTVGAGANYRPEKPIVYYGSSITQGGCASRPGMTYQSHICRRLNIDYINLGFSGACRGEKVMVDYLASLEMSAFVSDYDHNAPTVEHLRNTHYALYEAIRAAHPDIPYIMITRPDVQGRSEECAARTAVIRESYERALANGDKNVRFIDGADLFAGADAADCTVDTCHPNDLGFWRMANVIGGVLEASLAEGGGTPKA